MRILVISNLYPPHHAGGYELACEEMVANLKGRGHEIIVLTSTYGEGRLQTEDDVYRWLMLRFERRVNWRDVLLKERLNQAAFRHVCEEFSPEVVFFWNMSHISISLAAIARDMGLPTCYYIFDNWLATWEMDHWFQLWRARGKGLDYFLHRLLSRKFALIVPPFLWDMSSVVFASSYLKSVALSVGKPVQDAAVVHWGIDIDKFPYKSTDSPVPSRLLYVGQIVPHKGIETVIEALGITRQSLGDRSLSFDIVGDHDGASTYTAFLKDVAGRCDVDDRIAFIGAVLRENLPNVYQSHDILVFPSLWDEPFGITQLEAMSSGLAVIGTGTGGSAEILESEVNCLTYSKGDAAGCARQISRLLENRSLFRTLRRNGRKTVEKKFRIDQTVDLLEKALVDAPKVQRSNKKVWEVATTSKRVRRQEFAIKAASYKKQLKLVKLACQAAEILNPLRWAKNLIIRSEIILVALALALLRKSSLLPPLRKPGAVAFAAHRIQTVLVIHLAGKDRAVLISPFLRELRRFLPHAWIGLVVRPATANLFEKCPYIDKVMVFDGGGMENGGKSKDSPVLSWLGAIRYVMRNFNKVLVDMAILPGWEDERELTASHALMRLIGAPWRLGYLEATATPVRPQKISLDQPFTYGPQKGMPRNEVESQLDILRFLGAHIASTDTEVWLSEEDYRYAGRVMANAASDSADFVVALSPGGQYSGLQWPVERFIRLGRWLQEDYNAYILVIADDAHLVPACQIYKGLVRGRAMFIGDSSRPRRIAALLERCKMFVGAYSGLIHLAAAVGIPVITIFGPEDYRRFSPRGAGHEVIRLHLLCDQCGGACLYTSPLCLDGIEVSKVKRLVAAKLEPCQ
ncbi:MAG: glycosyltransferase [Deltaproteobacteria bacterium]|nr:glycosyltransferase [Deltaproteobacteria bacterium]MBW2071176.1 glycosyltransferase [Deltaproteobacteria bacterium]